MGEGRAGWKRMLVICCDWRGNGKKRKKLEKVEKMEKMEKVGKKGKSWKKGKS